MLCIVYGWNILEGGRRGGPSKLATYSSRERELVTNKQTRITLKQEQILFLPFQGPTKGKAWVNMTFSIPRPLLPPALMPFLRLSCLNPGPKLHIDAQNSNHKPVLSAFNLKGFTGQGEQLIRKNDC